MNEQLRNVWTRVSTYLNRFSPTQKRNLAISLVAAVLCIVVIVWVTSRPNYVTVLSGLDNKSLGDVQSKLEELKIPVEISGSSVLVPSRSADTARVQLAMAGLPKTGMIGYSNLPNSMGMTQDQFNIQVLDALQNSLSQTIQSFDGIESAQVHIVMPQQQIFVSQDTSTAKASVFVQVAPGVQLSPAQVSGIEQLVAHSVTGLQPSDVSVVDQNGVTLQGSQSDTSQNGIFGTTELGVRQQLEQSLSSQLTEGLSRIAGPGNAVVMVHANMSFDQVQVKSHTVVPAPGSTTGLPTSQQTIRKTSTDASQAASGVVGASSNNPGLQTYAGTTASPAGSSSSDTETNTNYDNSYTDATTVKDPIQLQGYTVGVFLNSANKNLTPQLVAEIKSFVANAVGMKAGPGLSNNITVATVPFSTTTLPTGFAMGQQNNLLLWGGLGGGVVVLAAAWLWNRKRKQQKERELAALSEVNEVVHEDLEQVPMTEDERMKEQLVKLANHRPAEFTNLLRNWLMGD